ncbi:aspartate racemase [Burkholderia ubonensis]|uniref:aspartate/glutamate racemase family protein n=1 Tax=Burkholderia ubonensis TaxID=101571 RepID=UPI00075831DE|nr:amino acid racemase [Burkholderia ubonensis]KWD09359.1 aspartate racemase [Burkholderia ubonensis]KWD26332.1 aspartate racemase [Burkholderia ubonensis]KWQ01793.1 aspartate racemase [Burkholderia ubonensis]
MALIGVLGGMGPLATVDFMQRVMQLTRARCDQEHLSMIVANLTHTPDRSRAIVAGGVDPLPALLDGIDLLNRCGAGVIVIPCNSAHHWYAQMAERSAAPILHIVDASVAAVPAGVRRVAVLATGGALVSGFYQASLRSRGIEPVMPAAAAQRDIAACIEAVKATRIEAAAGHLSRALATLERRKVSVAVMGCTEIPIAARALHNARVMLIDSTQELARATVAYAVERGWGRAM